MLMTITPADPLDVLTVNEVAAQLKLSVYALRRMLTTGLMPGLKVGHVWRIRRQELVDWLEKNHNQKSDQK